MIILGDAQGVTFAQLSLVVDFIYTGAVTVPRDVVPQKNPSEGS